MEQQLFIEPSNHILNDNYTQEHCSRVARYSYLIAEILELPYETKKRIYKAGKIHDIGKQQIAPTIINKPDKLDENEYNIMKEHININNELLANENLIDLKPIIRAHHEKYDGTGYPDNLKGEQIPIEARVLAVADAFDAMTSQRSYNKIKTIAETIEELNKNSGTQFDPEVTQVLIKILRKTDKFERLLPRKENYIN